MWKFTRLILPALIVAALLPATLTAAQTAEPAATAEADEARAVVLQAMHGIMAESYHYTSQSTILSQYLHSDKSGQLVVTLTRSDGDVAPGGDNHMLLTSAGGATIEAAQSGPHVELERIVADGVVYVELTDAVRQFLPGVTAEPGWYRLDDLLAKLDNTPLRTGLQSLANVAMPSKLLVDDKYVLGVTEDAPETVDGVATRVFDVRLDGFSLSLDQSPGTVVDHLKQLYKNRKFYDAATFDYGARVWINSDGQVLKLDITSHTVLPYASRPTDQAIDYDVDVSVIGEVTLSNYGQPVEIEVPTVVE